MFILRTLYVLLPVALLLLSAATASTRLDRVGILFFKKQSLDFGEVQEGKKARLVYECVNKGNYPIVISQVRGSCGCVVGSYPREPIAPDEKAKIEVIFDASGKSGAQKKIITVISNAENSEVKLHLSGIVISKK